ncbi:unnamed protein product [Pleuronectes platessa]|uniref:Uncharacterized protein n=1 Tax=Pleuronectes platessa TaxID=8262 RepID=A0A9N7UGW0_PLEPL|nr:unnamed protein product [Pleuronectes platessa]
MCISPPASSPFSILASSHRPEGSPEHLSVDRASETERGCVVHAPSRSVCEQSSVSSHCCKVSGTLSSHLALSRSTAGTAVSDKRVSAAAAAIDQASLPGLWRQGREHILASNWHPSAHSRVCSLLTHTEAESRVGHTNTQHATSASRGCIDEDSSCDVSDSAKRIINQLWGYTERLYIDHTKPPPASAVQTYRVSIHKPLV